MPGQPNILPSEAILTPLRQEQHPQRTDSAALISLHKPRLSLVATSFTAHDDSLAALRLSFGPFALISTTVDHRASATRSSPRSSGKKCANNRCVKCRRYFMRRHSIRVTNPPKHVGAKPERVNVICCDLTWKTLTALYISPKSQTLVLVCSLGLPSLLCCYRDAIFPTVRSKHFSQQSFLFSCLPYFWRIA